MDAGKGCTRAANECIRKNAPIKLPSTIPAFLMNHLDERIVITGIGMITSIGHTREEVWRAVRQGTSGVRRLSGLPGIPDGLLIGAPVDIEPEYRGGLKVTALCQRAAAEAIDDSGLDLGTLDLSRFACAVSGHVGDLDGIVERTRRPELMGQDKPDWFEQWLPNTACSKVATRFGLRGPRLCHSTACASGLIDFLAAVRSIRDSQCDFALAGSGEAINPLFAAGFYQMKVLADHVEDPRLACRPFDVDRCGFVMGEGAAMFVIERLSHALDRGAEIYAEVMGGRVLADAHHVTGLDTDSEALSFLISDTLRRAKLVPRDVPYINAHGTGTTQNDVMEARAIRRAFDGAANHVWVSSCKSMFGHLINAAGSVELAITALALRDGFAPPTLNLRTPDPECDLDCLPMVGRAGAFEHALKVSVAFGGHLAAVMLRRWETTSQLEFELPAQAA